MKKLSRKQPGITLIALVITIAILIVLVGITISLILGENGIIKKTIQMKETQKIAELAEMLELKKMPIQFDTKGHVLLVNYLEYIKQEGIIEDTDIETLDDLKCYIIVEDEYIFLLDEKNEEDVNITYQGKSEELPPRITDFNITTTSSTIKVQVEGMRLEGATYQFYIKNEEDEQYKEVQETNQIGEYTFGEEEGLTQNHIYYFKVEATTSTGTAEKEGNATTGVLVTLTNDNTTFTTEPSEGWTNTNVTTKVETEVSGSKIQYSKDLKTWYDYTDGIESENNEVIYVRLTDGTNVGEYLEKEIDNIDKNLPEDATITLSGAGTVKTNPTVKATVKHTDNDSGVDISACKWVVNNSSDKLGTEPSSYTDGTFTSNSQQISISLSNTGNYYIHVLTEDNAGNRTETVSGAIKLAANTHTHSENTTSGGDCYEKVTNTTTSTCGLSVTLTNHWDNVWNTGSCMAGTVWGNCANGHKTESTVTWGYGTSWNGSVETTCKSTVTTTTYSYKLSCGYNAGDIVSYVISY